MSGIEFYRDRSLPFLEVKLCSDKSASYKKHFHEEYSLGVIDEGESTVWVDGRNLEVEAGRLIWIPPYLPHACNPQETAEWRYKMLFFHPDWVHDAVQDKVPVHKAFLADKEKNRRCNSLLNRLVSGMRNKQTPLETESAAIGLINAILSAETADEGRPDAYKLKPHTVRVKQYLHEHYLEGITLERLEQVSGISRFHLIHAFKQEHNIPPHAYQNLLRINFAKKQLGKGLRPISDIAVEAGFYDQSHFTRLFKHFVGVTPQKYVNSL